MRQVAEKKIISDESPDDEERLCLACEKLFVKQLPKREIGQMYPMQQMGT